MKYELSPDLFPAEQPGRMDWVTTTGKQVEELRVDYLLANNRPADARVLIEQALERLNAEEPSERTFYDRTGWFRRLADAEAQGIARMKLWTITRRPCRTGQESSRHAAGRADVGAGQTVLPCARRHRRGVAGLGDGRVQGSQAA